MAMKKLVPVVIALLGVLGGAGAGYFLRPVPGAEAHAPEGEGHAPTAEDHAEAPAEGHEAAPAEGHGEAMPVAEATAEGEGENSGVPDYVKLSNQFVVPVVEDGRVAAMVILSLTLEVPAGGSEAIYAREPKLRDAFLQVLFDHANAGGFRGTFTDGANLVILRNALREVAMNIMGGGVSDVLIADIVRQDN
jgi:flagellar protein FliL